MLRLMILTLPVFAAQGFAQESSVGFGTYSEQKAPVPLQIIAAGPTHHVIDVLQPDPLHNGLVKLKPNTPYVLKLRLGSRYSFRYLKLGGFSVPPTADGDVVQVQLEANKLTVKQTRTVTDSSTTRTGNQVTFSSSSKTVIDYEKTYDLSPSGGDEYGTLRDWTSVDGKVIKAIYVVADSSKVTLKGMDGRIYQAALAAFSAADQAFVARFAENSK